ncbi:MAG: ABC transporter ATP-binding protein/permease [archaeon]|nr:ABC transporter ATP-binding protein/permease [archaeon]
MGLITKFFRRRDWALTLVGVAFIIAQVFLDIQIPEYMNLITDAFLLNNADRVLSYGSEMVVCAFLSLGASLVVGFILANVSASVGRNIRIELFDRVQSFAVQDINRFSAASLITRSTSDVYQIQTFLARGMQVCIKSPILAVWALSKIWGSAIEWSLIVIVGLVVLLVVMFVTLHFAIPKFKNIQWLTDGVNRSTRENLDGIRVIRAYNAESRQEERFEQANGELLDNNLSAMRYMAPTFPIAQSLMNFITLGIYWAGAGIIASAGSHEQQLLLFSDMIVFTSYATIVLSSLMQFIGIFRMLPRALVGLRRIEEVLATETSVKDGPETEGVEGSEGVVEFRDVSFAYPGSDHDVLEGISFRVERGSTFAVIGSTGSGKTSLVNLITRFYDVTGGQVLVGGRDVRDYNVRALHLRMGYVPQNAIIFSGSVRMNVNYGSGAESRTDEDIRKALRVAQAGFADDLPEGWESHISQHGRNLSGGQKQRVAIARAVCRSPEIYLFDDTFSALDFKTDRALREALRRETAGSTVIIIAQRVGTIMDADTIMVLDNGRIAGIGTHRELLERCEVYRDIARSQLTEEELQ